MPKVENEIPDYLSHYTNLDGLKGIIETKCLWASNASYLNDKAELTHALKASEKAIKLLLAENVDRRWGSVISEVFRSLAGDAASNTYVSCFCLDDDNLSQWRGYSGGSQGVCITFDRVRLSRRFLEDGAELLKVVYTDKTTSKKLQRELAKEIDDIESFRSLLGPLTEKEMRSEIYSRASKCLPKFKYLGFKDERECRYIVQENIGADRIRFRVSNNKLVPYIEIGKKESKLPIRSIRVGPGYDQELTAASIKEFLRINGYKVDVLQSSIPFRL